MDIRTAVFRARRSGSRASKSWQVKKRHKTVFLPTALRVAAAPAVLLCAFVASSATAASSASSSSATGSAAAACPGLAHAQQQLAKYSAVPKFTTPGPPLSVKKLKGKLIFLIPAASTIPFNQILDNTAVQVAKSVGVKLTVFENQGQPSQWVQGVNEAIAEHASALIMTDIDPRTIAPQMTALHNAHIPVILDSTYDQIDKRFQSKSVAASIPSPYHLAGELVADSAIVATNCQANVLYLQSAEFLNFQYETPGVVAEFTKYCPTCDLTVVDVPFLDWATQLQSDTTSALLANPKINWVIPGVDAMYENVQPGIASTSRTGIQVSTFNGTPFALTDIATGTAVYSDAGEPLAWKAYATLDQTFRVLLGMKPVAENTPIRVFTKANVAAAGNPAAYTQGYGKSYVHGFLKLWGATK
jgi:ribose transport system substrate-binding protein